MSDQQAPEATDQSLDQVTDHEAPDASSQTSTVDPERYTQFDLSEVPDEYRDHVAQFNTRLQGDYTRKTQELAEQRQTYEAAQEAAGLLERLRTDRETQLQTFRDLAELFRVELPELEDGDETDGGVDPDEWEAENETGTGEPLFTSWMEEMELLAQRQQVHDALSTAYESATKTLGRDLTDQDKALYEALMPATITELVESNGPFDAVDGAVTAAAKVITEQFQQRDQAAIETYRQSKASPFISNNGVAGTEKYDPSDPESRKKYALQIVEGLAEQANPNT